MVSISEKQWFPQCTDDVDQIKMAPFDEMFGGYSS